MDHTDFYHGLKPAELWRHFAAFNRIPRTSGHEIAARTYVQSIADSVGCKWNVDLCGNVVVYLPATPNASPTAEKVAIQGHLDMVAAKEAGSPHDFLRDPIRPRRDGDCIFGTGTTLGADNGIGISASLALLTSQCLTHGPLELVFTVEEETGLYGAENLDASLVKARYLINLDSENDQELTVGSAAGAAATITLEPGTDTTPSGYFGRRILVSGLKGGHSGLQIHEPLANAIKLAANVIRALEDGDIDFRMGSISGGEADNVIPRQADVTLAVSPLVMAKLEAILHRVEGELRREWVEEPNLALTVEEIDTPARVWMQSSQNLLVQLITSLPHGALKMSASFPGKVQTSANLANVRTENEQVKIVLSVRSFVAADLEDVIANFGIFARNANGRIEMGGKYPSWEPNLASPLLELTKSAYRVVRGKSPEVQILHGGLECGLIAAKIPSMNAISFGPLIRGAHTPEEHIYISTVEPTWKVLVELLQTIAQNECVVSQPPIF
jgi:dipeptidase D